MNTTEFIKKFCSRYLWINILSMGLFIAIFALTAHFVMSFYTHHGESITIPDVKKMSYEDAERTLADLGFEIEVADTGYNKSLPPGTVLQQMPAAGTIVKSGRIIYLTINNSDTPTLVIPDVIDNSSLREAKAKLTALGFKLGPVKYIQGEKDWVYDLLINNRKVSNKQRVPVESIITIVVGDGKVGDTEELEVTDAPEDSYDDFDYSEHSNNASSDDNDKDDFEVVE